MFVLLIDVIEDGILEEELFYGVVWCMVYFGLMVGVYLEEGEDRSKDFYWNGFLMVVYWEFEGFVF